MAQSILGYKIALTHTNLNIPSELLDRHPCEN